MSKQLFINWGVPAIFILTGVGGFAYNSYPKNQSKVPSDAIANSILQKPQIGEYTSCGRCD